MTLLHALGARSPRYRRALQALLSGPVSRERLDRTAGCSNSPAMIERLRKAGGLSLPCTRVRATDRDGRICRPGVYSLSLSDRRKLLGTP